MGADNKATEYSYGPRNRGLAEQNLTWASMAGTSSFYPRPVQLPSHHHFDKGDGMADSNDDDAHNDSQSPRMILGFTPIKLFGLRRKSSNEKNRNKIRKLTSYSMGSHRYATEIWIGPSGTLADSRLVRSTVNARRDLEVVGGTELGGSSVGDEPDKQVSDMQFRFISGSFGTIASASVRANVMEMVVQFGGAAFGLRIAQYGIE
uniref:Uncharacterized protein n=1 Tax=Vespula pensylvanica TaxID=30213 RepID=A0A834P718_VESPE|nr:hypothetical protein H0235_004255 [Vespula pensylvanica]